MEQFIIYKDKKYPIKEPTILNYANVMKLRDLLSEEELYIRVICELTELSREQILEAPADQFKIVGETIERYFSAANKEVFYNIKFKDVEYSMIDIYNISFGQFVDIDTFLNKEESYKLNNLNELASYLYLEKGKTYSEIDFRKQKEIFADLPMKYLEGAIFFLANSGLILAPLMETYSRNKFQWVILKTILIFQLIGVGIPRYPISPKTGFGKFLKLLTYPLWLVSITLRISLMWIGKKIKNRNRK
jgi:hypothetical protein